ncbi:hypothetical protein D9M70_219750 [compost metagenome]
MRLEPKAPIWFITARLLPSPTASITTTEATPMTMPSRVSAVRKRLIHMTRQAACMASRMSASSEAPPLSPRARRSAMVSGAVVVPALPLSLRISPSRISMTRRARAATSRSWVMRMMVWPRSASSSSRAMTSAPLRLSRAPVGSSARMIWPPFIRARAMDTRCCWPPESWLGRCSRRSPRPRRASRAVERWRRCSAGVPA